MNKITSIHLNGKAYQLEEQGYDALRAYLTHAEKQLSENPDKAEILSDLEQAIAEKCDARLRANKDVVTTQEVTQILQEMGPVEGPEKSEAPKTEQTTSNDAPQTPKRLYLIREGAMFAGVCNGLAAYFNLDVLLVRLIFVALTILTGGAWILVYAAMMFVVPYANTSEERAQAYGEAFNAQEIVNRAKESYSRLTDKGRWERWGERMSNLEDRHRERVEKKRDNRAERRAARQAERYHYRPVGTSAFLGFVSMVLAVLWIAALISLINTGAIFGWAVTAYIPIWLAIVLLFIVFHAVTGPMRAGRWMRVGNQWHPADYAYDGWHGVVDGLGILFLVISFWFAYTHFPEVQSFINAIPHQFQNLVDSLKKG